MPEKIILRPVRFHLFAVVVWTLTALIFTPAAQAQITSPEADGRDSLDYPVSGGKVVAFAFHQEQGLENNGSLTAVHPEGGTFDFEWQKFNPLIMDYDPFFQSDAGVSSSSVQDLDEGGYRVRVSNGTDIDTLMSAWVWKIRLEVNVTSTADDHLPIGQRTCDYIVLFAEVESDSVVEYYDPLHPDALSYNIGPRFLWTSDNENLTIPNADRILSPNQSYSPPYEDTWYILTVTDSTGISVVDSVFYESIQTKAEFSIEYWDKIKSEWNPDLYPGFHNSPINPNDPGNWPDGSTDAALTVRFVNESKNGVEFHWTFVDTLASSKETAVTYDTTERPEFTYFDANEKYFPSLLSISDWGCEDSSVMAHVIEVVKSMLVIPNVFSPNGDGTNDYWHFAHQSIETCKITVVDRSGQVVYKKKIEDIYDWDDWYGWDGNIRGSNRPAPAGAYYYVVEAMGYDGEEWRDPGVWEQMKIFGGEGRVDTQNPGSSTGGSGQNGENTSLGVYASWLYLYRD